MFPRVEARKFCFVVLKEVRSTARRLRNALKNAFKFAKACFIPVLAHGPFVPILTFAKTILAKSFIAIILAREGFSFHEFIPFLSRIPVRLRPEAFCEF